MKKTREVLFRGRAINRIEGREYRTNYKNGDWVYGLISKPYRGDFPSLPAEMTNTYGVSGIDVDYTTIGQYTGLADKNGVKIFEGDIVHCISRLDNANCVVIFEEGEFRLVPVRYYKTYITEGGYHAVRCFEKVVIGNIHDNPKLLK